MAVVAFESFGTGKVGAVERTSNSTRAGLQLVGASHERIKALLDAGWTLFVKRT